MTAITVIYMSVVILTNLLKVLNALIDAFAETIGKITKLARKVRLLWKEAGKWRR